MIRIVLVIYWSLGNEILHHRELCSWTVIRILNNLLDAKCFNILLFYWFLFTVRCLSFFGCVYHVFLDWNFFKMLSQLCVGYDYVYYHKKESGMCHRIWNPYYSKVLIKNYACLKPVEIHKFLMWNLRWNELNVII